MATVTEKMHPYEAAKAAGREPFKVRNLAEAEFGRKEMRLAEQEMPGLMALRAQHGASKPLAGTKVPPAQAREIASAATLTFTLVGMYPRTPHSRAARISEGSSESATTMTGMPSTSATNCDSSP